MTFHRKKDKSDRRLKRATYLGYILPKITENAFRRHGFAAADLMANWPYIVSPFVAQYSVPHRFSNGVLTLSCPSTVAIELHYQQQAIIARINTWYGEKMVRRLKFIHNSAVPKKMKKPAVKGRPEQMQKRCSLPQVKDSDIRDILERIGTHVLNED